MKNGQYKHELVALSLTDIAAKSCLANGVDHCLSLSSWFSFLNNSSISVTFRYWRTVEEKLRATQGLNKFGCGTHRPLLSLARGFKPSDLNILSLSPVS